MSVLFVASSSTEFSSNLCNCKCNSSFFIVFFSSYVFFSSLFRINTVSCQVLCQFSLCLTVVDDNDFSSDLCNYVSVILVFFSFFVSYVFFISLFRTNMSCDICLKQFSAGRRQQVIPCKATKCHINIHRECYPGGMMQ